MKGVLDMLTNDYYDTITKNFSLLPCSTGIDKTTFKGLFLDLDAINIQQLLETIESSTPITEISFDPVIKGTLTNDKIVEYLHSAHWTIVIKNSRFGKLTIKRRDYKTNVTHELPNCIDTINIPTVGINGLRFRISVAQNYFLKEWGLPLNYDSAVITKIEIAFTFFTSGMLPFEVRHRFVQCIAKSITPTHNDPYPRYYYDPNPDYTVIASIFKKSDYSMTINLYDKTAKAFFTKDDTLANNYNGKSLSPDIPRVYRLEFTLTNKKAFNHYFSSNLLSELNEEKIIDYLREMLNNGLKLYIEEHNSSVVKAANLIKTAILL